MTPYEIEVFIHHACTEGPHPRSHAPIYRETVEQMVEDGLFTQLLPHPDGLTVIRPTDKGLAFLQMLKNTPLPDVVHIDPRNGEPL